MNLPATLEALYPRAVEASRNRPQKRLAARLSSGEGQPRGRGRARSGDSRMQDAPSRVHFLRGHRRRRALSGPAPTRHATGALCAWSKTRGTCLPSNVRASSAASTTFWAGVIAPLDGIGPEELSISALVERCTRETVRELIIATNPTWRVTRRACTLRGSSSPSEYGDEDSARFARRGRPGIRRFHDRGAVDRRARRAVGTQSSAFSLL